MIARLLWPWLQIDAVSLGLLALVILPWLTPLIKSAELPGGWKVEFQDVEKAAEKITGPQIDVATTGEIWRGPAAEHASTAESSIQEFAISSGDPNLVLVALRIEVEKRIRALATRARVLTGSLLQLLHALRARGIISADQAVGLEAMISAGNKAAHGAQVDPSVAAWARTRGADILKVLDGIIGRPGEGGRAE